MQNPYQIMGVKETDSIEQIDKVYTNFMMILHPDRENTPSSRALNMSRSEKMQFMQIIREAYRMIIDLKKKQISYPDYNIEYDTEDIRINMNKFHLNETKVDPNNFNSDHFNKAFENSLESDSKSGMEDAYKKGYNSFDNGKDYNNGSKVTMPTRVDISVEKPKEFKRPDMKDNRLVEYVPQFMSLNQGINYEELGLSNISDFSVSTVGKGKLAGTDLMSVYGSNYEYWEETAKRDNVLYSKYTDSTNIGTKMQQYKSTRENIYKEPIDQRMLKLEADQNKIQMQQEKLRRINQSRRDEYYNEINRGMLPPSR